MSEHPERDHEHQRDHEHGDDHRFGRGHFDDRAASWDENPEHAHRAEVIASAIADRVALDPTMRVLDYGAGTGLAGQALRDHVGPLTLADTSQGMRSVIESKIEAGLLGDATVWDVDLAVTPPPADAEFDLIVTVMTLHHVVDLAAVLDAFARLLVPGGHLCIADLEEEDGSFHGDGFHGHHGFARSTLAAALVAAGFDEPDSRTVYHVDRDGRRYPVFLAITARPPVVDG